MAPLVFFVLAVLLLVCISLASLYFTYLFLPKVFLLVMTRYWVIISPGVRRKFVRVKDFTFCYYERKAATTGKTTKRPPTLMFLHGFSADKTLWLQMVRFLPSDWGLVVPDMPGHGDTSYKPKDDYSRKGYAEKINRFVEALQLENFHLVGMSMGALMSATYATLYPEKLKSLTLMSMPCLETLPGGQKTDLWRRFEREGTASRMMMSENAEEYKERMTSLVYDPKPIMPHCRMRQALVELDMPRYEQLIQIRNEAVNACDPEELGREMASEITMPTLVAWGKDDKLCHPAGAAVLGSIIEGAKVVMFDKCAHGIMIEWPEKCAAVVSNFISKH